MSTEALLFYSGNDDPFAWRQALLAHLPDLDFRVYPEVGDPAEIRYALAWKPPPGLFAPFCNIALLVNLGAGVDALIGRDDLPPVLISRLSDSGMRSLMTSYVVFAVTRYARDIHHFERAQRRGEWRYIHPRPLSSVSVGVLGLGELGRAAAEALAGLGFDLRGWSRTPKEIAGVRTLAGTEGLGPFLAGIEILVVMLPLTLQTRNLIGARELAMLPRGACVINVSRGAVVDEQALLEALRSGQIAEATLDVFTQEPLPPGHPFWHMENILITPHLASVTVPELAAPDVAESIRRVRRGEPPLHQVDPARGY